VQAVVPAHKEMEKWLSKDVINELYKVVDIARTRSW
jgi:hypothetical protein